MAGPAVLLTIEVCTKQHRLAHEPELLGNNILQTGVSSSALSLPTGGVPQYTWMGSPTHPHDQDRRSLFAALMGRSGGTDRLDFGGQRSGLLSNLFGKTLQDRQQETLSTYAELREAWEATKLDYSSTGSYGEALFAHPDQNTMGLDAGIDGGFIKRLESVVKMIHLSKQGALGKVAPPSLLRLYGWF